MAAFEGRSLPQSMPDELIAELSKVQGRFAVILGIRRNDDASIADGLRAIADPGVSDSDRLQVLAALGEVRATRLDDSPTVGLAAQRCQ